MEEQNQMTNDNATSDAGNQATQEVLPDARLIDLPEKLAKVLLWPAGTNCCPFRPGRSPIFSPNAI